MPLNLLKNPAFILGTRPEVIKLFPLIKVFEQGNVSFTIIHTGQHTGYNLFLNFLEEFEIRKPDYALNLDHFNNAAEQFSMLSTGISNIFGKCDPSSIITVGDTNSVAAASLMGTKLKIPVIHIESGLRSYDWRMQEEYNRVMVDHISDILFAPTMDSASILKKEQVPGKIYIVGNTVMDAVRLCFQGMENKLANKKIVNSNPEILNLKPDQYVLLTLHREENISNPELLARVFYVLAEFNLKYVFPAHPHTIKNLHEYNLDYLINDNIKIISPLNYHDFLWVLKNCKFAITDSGGLQEEVTSPLINKKAIVFRESTERPESILSGHVILSPLDMSTMRESIKRALHFDAIDYKYYSPYGDGYTAERIFKILKEDKIIPLSETLPLRNISYIPLKTQ